MDTVERALRVACINLSFVLHEPSTSPAVVTQARRLLARRRRLESAIVRLQRLDDLMLLPRVVLRDQAGVHAVQAHPPNVLLTLRLGAWPLLQRVMTLHLPETRAAALLYLVDAEPISPPWSVPVFRAPAALALPPPEQLGRQWAAFATLAFRPGRRSVLLDIVPLPGDPVEAGPGWRSALAGAIETALRDFTDQWWCRRALWAAPAELVLPEFAGVRS